MYKYMKYLILISFTIIMSLEDIKYKKIKLKFFYLLYLITLISLLPEVFYLSAIDNQYFIIIDNIKNLIIPFLICFICFIGCIKKYIPIGEGDILFIFILFLYFKTHEALLIIASSLFFIFIISVFIIFKNLLTSNKFKNKTLPFIPAFIPGIIYFIGVNIWTQLKLHLPW